MIISKILVSLTVLLIEGHSTTVLENEGVTKYPQSPNSKNCYREGYQLYGRFQIVESIPNLKVQGATSFADLKVKVVENHRTRCGESQLVNNFPDLKVQVVSSFPDLISALVVNRHEKPLTN